MCPLPVPQSQCATLAWQGPSPLQDVLAWLLPPQHLELSFVCGGSLSQVLPLSMPSWTDPAWKGPSGCSCVDSTCVPLGIGDLWVNSPCPHTTAPSSTQAHHPTQDEMLLQDFKGMDTCGIADLAWQGAAQGVCPSC